MEGSAMFTIVLSSATMTRLLQQTARMSSRRRRLGCGCDCGCGTSSPGADRHLILAKLQLNDNTMAYVQVLSEHRKIYPRGDSRVADGGATGVRQVARGLWTGL